MSLVLDASVVAKWVIDEDGSDRASQLRNERDLLAPSLIAAEIGSALWKAVQRRDIRADDALAAIQAVLRPFDRLVPIEELHARALEIAIDVKHPIYDCFYLALAKRENATVVTADKRLITAARKAKVEARML